MWELLLLVMLGLEALLLMRLGSWSRAFPPFYTQLVVLGLFLATSLFSIVFQESESNVKFLVILAI